MFYNFVKVECVKMGPNVSVDKFEGESSGLTSRKEINWQTEEDITFIVSGQYDGVS